MCRHTHIHIYEYEIPKRGDKRGRDENYVNNILFTQRAGEYNTRLLFREGANSGGGRVGGEGKYYTQDYIMVYIYIYIHICMVAAVAFQNRCILYKYSGNDNTVSKMYMMIYYI